MKFSLTPLEYCELTSAVRDAVKSALSSSRSEPNLVASLVCEIPKQVNALGPLGSYQIQSGGVFVHAQPFVKCADFPEPKPESVEIGDLLLVRSEVSHGAIDNRRALLLQAKKTSSLPATPDNKNQHHLYANWPSFKYVRSGPKLNGKKRHITGPDLYSAAKYLLIFDPIYSLGVSASCIPSIHRGGCIAATAAPSSPKLSNYRCFSAELTDFLLGDSGKPFVSPPPGRARKWDRVIDDLISTTAAKKSAFVGRASSPATRSANRGTGIYFALTQDAEVSKHSVFHRFTKKLTAADLDGSDDPPFDDYHPEENDEPRGISVIEFIVESENDRD